LSGRAFFLLICWWAAGGFTAQHLHAAESLSAPVLSPNEREAIARAFAPTLVLHPLEEYLPLSSMLPLGDDITPDPWPTRVARYKELSPEEKRARAALGYRVFSRVHRGRTEVVAEYWCYYVYNSFIVRGGWLPYRVNDNHPHDLERIYLVLTPSEAVSRGEDEGDELWARRAFRIRSVIVNAHDGSIPPNEYNAREDAAPLSPPLSILVERGSHAMAPDLNRDGRFTPGVDSTSILKLQWGIRDRGATWGPYRASFMDGRDASALRLCGPEGEPDAEPCSRYVLYPVDDLQRWFRALNLTARARQEILGRTSFLIKTFGDVRIEKLMVPSDPPDGSVLDKMIGRRTADSGIVAGFKSVSHAPAVIVGGRYFWAVPSRHAPDVVAEAVGVFPSGRRGMAEATVWGSYSVDAITNIIVGTGLFSEGSTVDVMAGVDFRIGRFRVRPSWRLREHVFDSRITTTF
jgi:hypothetical protein